MSPLNGGDWGGCRRAAFRTETCRSAFRLVASFNRAGKAEIG